METRTERVVLQTPNHEITGDITLPKEGFRSRLSDFLNHGEMNFISLINAEIKPRNGSTPAGPTSRSFIAVARSHVQLAYPASD